MPNGNPRPAIAPHVKALLDEQVSVDLRAGRMDEQRGIMQRVLAASIAGDVIQPGRLYMAARGEVSKVGSVIFDSIKKVVDSGELPSGEDSVNELLQSLIQKFDPIVSGIRKGLGTHLSLGAGHTPADQFDEHAEDIRRREKVKIRLLMARIMRDESSRTNSPTFTFQNSPVRLFPSG